MSFTSLIPQLPQFAMPPRGRNRMVLLASCAGFFVVAVGGLVIWSHAASRDSKLDAVPKLTDLPGAAASDSTWVMNFARSSFSGASSALTALLSLSADLVRAAECLPAAAA